MEKRKIRLEGLDCANCARELEGEIAKIPGVAGASIDFSRQILHLEYEDGEALVKAIDAANHFEEVRVVGEGVSSGKKKIRLEGLDCANCARELEEEIAEIPGVVSANIDFSRQILHLEYEDGEALAKAIDAANHFEEVRVVGEKKNPGNSAWAAKKWDFVRIIAAAALLFAGLILEHFVSGSTKLLTSYVWLNETFEIHAADIAVYACYFAGFFIVGWDVLVKTGKNIAKGRIFDENFLMTIAAVGAAVLGAYAEAVEVMVLYTLGETLQSIAVGTSRESVAALMDLRSETAVLLTEDGQREVPAESIRAGDRILCRAGEKIAADGIVQEGVTSLDVKSLTGEAALYDVGPGSEVKSGSINTQGVITVLATKDYSDSTVAKILELVENSSEKKADSEKFITKFARIYTPLVCLAAVVIAFLCPLFAAGAYLENLSSWVYKALNLLVISCPCAVVISVPLSYFSGIGFAAKHGILVKGSTGLDVLAKADIAAFDKTGTLTYGDFQIAGCRGEDTELLLAVAAAAEKESSHPLAATFGDIASGYTAEDVREIAGYGIRCRIEGKEVCVGNAKLMRECGIAAEEQSSVTLVYVSMDGEYLGSIEIEDRIKENAAEAVKALRALGIKECCMLTGDRRERAEKVAAAAGLDGVYAELLPDGKLETALQLKKKGTLLYVGDGINDAPVLMNADVGISMGGVGSDAAIEASDVVLMSDDLALLPQAKHTAKRTRSIVMQNIIGSITVKLVIMVLAVFSLVPLWLSVFADVGVMLLAVFNSFRTRIEFREKKGKGKTGNGSVSS